MQPKLCRTAAVLGLALFLAGSGRAADSYAVDDAHTAVYFKIEHLGISWTFGRFNEVAGGFVFDKDDPAKSSFTLTIKADSIDTANKKRDDHLRSPDFFNTKQYPTLSFKSTGVKAAEGGYLVTGDFTMHGVTKPVAFTLRGGKTAKDPTGNQRIGFSADLVLKRTDYGMDKLVPAVGDDVHIAISFEGVKK